MATLDSSVSLLNLFGDASRVRLLTLLEAHELTVAELTKVTELSQSRVSTHLGKLREAYLMVCEVVRKQYHIQTLIIDGERTREAIVEETLAFLKNNPGHAQGKP